MDGDDVRLLFPQHNGHCTAAPLDEIDDETRKHFRELQQSIGQNFSVLNDPREDKQAGWVGSFFTATAAEQPVRLSVIPKTTNESIKAYVTSLGPEYKAWRQARKAKREQSHALPAATAAGGTAAAASQQVQQVPREFFDPKTRYLVSNRAFLQTIMPGVDDPYDSLLLLSKLEYYQSEVNSALLARVKQRSPQFFEALQRISLLRSKVSGAAEQIVVLRQTVTQTEKESVTAPLTVFQLKRRAQNMKRLQEACVRLKQLKQLQQEVALKVHCREYVLAVNMLSAASYEKELEKLVCTRHIRNAFDNVRQQAFRQIHAGLVDRLLGDMSGQWPDMAEETPEARQRWCAELEGAIRPLLSEGVPAVREVLLNYRKGVYDEVKRVVSQTIFNAMRELTGDQPNLTQEELLKPSRLRGLSIPHFVFVLEKLFTAVFTVFRRTYRVTSALDLIVRKAHHSGFDENVLVELLADSRAGAVKMIQSRMVRMFEVRQEEHASLRFQEIAQIMRLAFSFIHRLGSVTAAADRDAASASFRSTLVQQARGFYKRQHERQQQKLLSILHTEQWQAEQEIDVSFQAFCDRLTDRSPDALDRARNMAIDQPGGGVIEEDEIGEGSNPRLSLDGSYYTVSHSILMLLRTLADCEQYAFAMPFLGNDFAQSIHDLLKCYDGQTSALILGAGARDTAGIETITVAHLIVSAQCLSFLSAFALSFKARLQAVLPPKSSVFLKNLDRFSKEAADHRNEFYVKVVLMFKEGQREWKPDNWSLSGSAWISEMLKDIGRLLKKKAGVERLLERRQLRTVMYPILFHCFAKIKQCVSNIPNLRSEPGLLDRVKEDIIHYKVNIERFGFSVLTSTKARDLTAANTWLPEEDEKLPESEEDVLAVFLPP
ncbi:Vacuolar protein sorting-associated protein 54 [Diplonema papillatum]|nr:Vacuolar protein sorting-associated protein 54 [Diplonema papillatum]